MSEKQEQPSYKLSPRWGDKVVKLSDGAAELKAVISEMNKQIWEAKPVITEQARAQSWHFKRLRKAQNVQVLDYEQARKTFWNFWRNYADAENRDFVLNSQNKETVVNILKWMIADPTGGFDLSKGLWIYGPVGTGKSVLMSAIFDFMIYLHEVKKANQSRVWKKVDMNELYIKSKFDPSMLKALITEYSLIVDELKPEHFTTGFAGKDRTIGDLITSRYSETARTAARTVIVTNLQPGFAPGTELADLLDIREKTRIAQRFQSVHWKGENLRIEATVQSDKKI